MSRQSSQDSRRFGKRGRVDLTPPSRPDVPRLTPDNANRMKWIGGSLAVIFLLGLLSGGTSGAGLLGGLLGGWLGSRLANNNTASTSAQSATKPGAATTTVQRSGFGSTGSGFGFFSGA